MYALIYENKHQDKPGKQVLSLHASCKSAQRGLTISQKDLGKGVWCAILKLFDR
ncbi:hypothetical protein [Desulfobacula sp.]|jgi:hypothetical protein|uniref:hypothetical protein n=1 Tax=Desulfobacula sp. TaxID=2593537 RepID=UPI001E1513DB|nr:hypothetical protein [Desulfobacula sp.]MBT4200874.1 hypothetical protein [Desulfobacula sp.]MBT4508568.1 hypothetical protein [Desulfobacula sp.]MBT5973779.1 hypothetical protein [Desulfobacula sp.]MBT7052078.1 hypothetical protein [Desulfobacula sp.]